MCLRNKTICSSSALHHSSRTVRICSTDVGESFILLALACFSVRNGKQDTVPEKGKIIFHEVSERFKLIAVICDNVNRHAAGVFVKAMVGIQNHERLPRKNMWTFSKLRRCQRQVYDPIEQSKTNMVRYTENQDRSSLFDLNNMREMAHL